MDGWMIEREEVDPSQGHRGASSFGLRSLLPPGYTEIFLPD